MLLVPTINDIARRHGHYPDLLPGQHNHVNFSIKELHAFAEDLLTAAAAPEILQPAAPILPQQGGEQTKVEPVNPYKIGSMGENWRRGFNGQMLLAYPTSDAARAHKEGVAARKEYDKPVAAAVLPQVGEAVAYRYRVLVDKHLTGSALEGEFEFKGIKGKSSGWMLSAEFPNDDFLLEVVPLTPASLGEAKAVAYMTKRGAVYKGEFAGPTDMPLFMSPPNIDTKNIARQNFNAGICVALQVITSMDCGVTWREIVEAVGVDDMIHYASIEEPEEWELAGFKKYAMVELRRRRKGIPK